MILALDCRAWGEWDAKAGEVRVVTAGPEAPAMAEDLTELAVRETLRHGGKVFVIPRSEVPGEGLLAAALRW